MQQNKTDDDSSEKILSFIKEHGVVDKDSARAGRPADRARKIDSRKRQHRFLLDLHGMRSDKARLSVRQALEACSEKGPHEVLIIHGQGYHSDPQEGPVLKKLVLDMLENECRSYVVSFKPALPRDGGDGATLVYVRR